MAAYSRAFSSMLRLLRCHVAESSAWPAVVCFCAKDAVDGSRSLSARFLELRLCVLKMSSLFGRERPLDGREEAELPEDISEDSWEVKESVVLDEISLPDIFLVGRGMEYRDASLAAIVVKTVAQQAKAPGYK